MMKSYLLSPKNQKTLSQVPLIPNILYTSNKKVSDFKSKIKKKRREGEVNNLSTL